MSKKIVLIAKLSLDENYINGGLLYFTTILQYLKNKYNNVDYISIYDKKNGKIVFNYGNKPDYIMNYIKIGNIIINKIKIKYGIYNIKNIFNKKKLNFIDFRKKYYGERWGAPLSEFEISFLKKIINKNKYDTVIVNYLNLCNIFDSNLPTVKNKIVLTNDIFHIRKSLFESYGIKNPDLVYWDKDNEKKYLNKANIIAAIQKDEANILSDMCPDKKIIVLPMTFKNNFDLSNKKNNNIIIVGSGNEINRRGVEYILEKVFPFILDKNNDINLNIYGLVCNFFKNANYKNVKFHGVNNDLTQAYKESKLAFVPLFAGTGLKIKTVEALSYGIPVLSTNFGLEGLLDSDNYCSYLCNTPEDFINNTIKLLENQNLYKKFALNANNYFNIHFSEEVAFNELNNVLNYN